MKQNRKQIELKDWNTFDCNTFQSVTMVIFLITSGGNWSKLNVDKHL